MLARAVIQARGALTLARPCGIVKGLLARRRRSPGPASGDERERRGGDGEERAGHSNGARYRKAALRGKECRRGLRPQPVRIPQRAARRRPRGVASGVGRAQRGQGAARSGEFQIRVPSAGQRGLRARSGRSPRRKRRVKQPYDDVALHLRGLRLRSSPNDAEPIGRPCITCRPVRVGGNPGGAERRSSPTRGPVIPRKREPTGRREYALVSLGRRPASS